jgi:hypothetical protein
MLAGISFVLFTARCNKGTATIGACWLVRSIRCHTFFDIEDSYRLVDLAGLNFTDDSAAIEKAKVIAIGVSLDKPAVDLTRRIAVLNADRHEIFSVPVYSKPV